MSLNQTVAIFEDAYRELNAKKMFWVTLGLTTLVVAAFATLGVGDNGFKFLWMDLGNGAPGRFMTTRQAALILYKVIFSFGVIGVWFTWAATILALISTSFIFPDFMTAGSIDLYLSKPISRLRLFFTKYFTGLLFAALQIVLFCTGTFLVLGLRAGIWKPGLFLGIPIVLCFFSYIYAFSVLFGVWTRSSIAAIMLTLLIWGALCGLHYGEVWTLARSEEEIRNSPVERLVQMDARIDAVNRAEMEAAVRKEMLDDLQKQRDILAAQPEKTAFRTLHNTLYYTKAIFPKTTETTNLLDRILFDDEQERFEAQGGPGPGFGRRNRVGFMEIMKQLGQRSVFWVVGTSLLFEALIVAMAAWIFCRRDY